MILKRHRHAAASRHASCNTAQAIHARTRQSRPASEDGASDSLKQAPLAGRLAAKSATEICHRRQRQARARAVARSADRRHGEAFSSGRRIAATHPRCGCAGVLSPRARPRLSPGGRTGISGPAAGRPAATGSAAAATRAATRRERHTHASAISGATSQPKGSAAAATRAATRREQCTHASAMSRPPRSKGKRRCRHAGSDTA